MSNQDFERASALNNIPSRKLEQALAAVQNGTDTNDAKATKTIAINRYAESNIPIEYWTLKMDRDFYGDPRLKEEYDRYVADLNVSYTSGTSICFAGAHGRGKTMTATCILKQAAQKGFNCLYTTLSDIVSVLIQGRGEDKFLARQELVKVDFLVIDEFDSRFFSTENAADLYARSLESIFRTRIQNKLPTIMCTNSPNVVESFGGSLRASIDSLMSGYMKMFPVMGDDFRKKAAK